MLKSLLQKTLAYAVKDEFVWAALSRFPLNIAQFAVWRRIQYEEEKLNIADCHVLPQLIDDVCPNLTVLNGVFKGMKYPQPRSTGSTLFPKLLGCYERELLPYLEELSDQNYTEIIDVGCAEGYYAVGMSLMFPNATVYAYDTNDEAIHLCNAMARLNGVEEKIIVGSLCDIDELQRIRFRGKGLVFSDCEGYEKHLFNQDSFELLTPHDLIIETHDQIDDTISEGICEVFENSHEIRRVQSLSDSSRLKMYRYKELERFDIATRYRLVRERRSNRSQWLILKSRTPSFSVTDPQVS